MWVRFVARAKQIEPDRTARYFTPGECLDLEPALAMRFMAEQSAVEAKAPGAPTHDDPFIPPSLGDDPLTVACVYRTGGVYDRVDYVGPLARAVARHLSRPHRFVCLTDAETVPVGVERVPLLHKWPGFWSKVELHRPGVLTGPAIYLDLDTVVCGSLDPIVDALAGNPVLASWDMQHGWINSSFLAWSVDLSSVYETMCADPAAVMAKYDGTGAFWGDQGLLQEVLMDWRIPYAWVQEAVPAAVAWQPLPLRGTAPAPGTTVSMWYGNPKPHEIKTEWMAQHWA